MNIQNQKPGMLCFRHVMIPFVFVSLLTRWQWQQQKARGDCKNKGCVIQRARREEREVSRAPRERRLGLCDVERFAVTASPCGGKQKMKTDRRPGEELCLKDITSYTASLKMKLNRRRGILCSCRYPGPETVIFYRKASGVWNFVNTISYTIHFPHLLHILCG